MKHKPIRGNGLSPFFSPEQFVPAYPALSEDRTTDVLVIGGGLSGLLCAYFLTCRGVEVLPVTADFVGSSASRWSDGTVTGDGGADLRQLVPTVGRENAVAWYRYCAGAAQTLEQVVRKTGSKCDFRRKECFYFTADPAEEPVLREEFRLRYHASNPCEWLSTAECMKAYSFPAVAGIVSDTGAEFDPAALCRDLAAYLSVHGAEPLEGTRITAVETAKDGSFLCHSGEHTIRAKRIVDARGSEVLRRRPGLGKRHTLFTAVTEPVPGFPGWEDQRILKSYDDFSFLRTTPEGRILCSGELSKTTPEGMIGPFPAPGTAKTAYAALEQKIREFFPGITGCRRESGFCREFIVTKHGLPYLGEDPAWKGMYYLYAFGEAGICAALYGAEKIASVCQCGSGHFPPCLAA